MKVSHNTATKWGDTILRFDKGVFITSYHEQDCCECNYLDFTQLPVGTDVPTMDARTLCEKIRVAGDGLIIRDSYGIPKWVQARSDQNGYYSWLVGVRIYDDKDSFVLASDQDHGTRPFPEDEVLGEICEFTDERLIKAGLNEKGKIYWQSEKDPDDKIPANLSVTRSW